MRLIPMSLIAFVAVATAVPAQAALWSSSNAITPLGGTTTMSISLTGDQRTVAAQVDVAIPTGIRAISATPRNGAHCNLISSGRKLRVLVMDANLHPLPAIAQPYCDLTIRVTAYATQWFTMSEALCIDGLNTSYQCALDRGHITITAP